MNFLIYMDFNRIFLNFFEFILSLFGFIWIFKNIKFVSPADVAADTAAK